MLTLDKDATRSEEQSYTTIESELEILETLKQIQRSLNSGRLGNKAAMEAAIYGCLSIVEEAIRKAEEQAVGERQAVEQSK